MAGPAAIRTVKPCIGACALLAVVAGSLGLLTASASARSSHTQTLVRTSSACSSASPAAVSALVGYTVPTAAFSSRHIAATTASDGISAVVTTCTFGGESTMKAMLKDVTLELEVTSKTLTLAAVEQDLKAALKGSTLSVSIKTYPSLGVPAVYLTESGDGIKGEEIDAFVGNHIYGATVLEPLSTSKLAALAKLAASIQAPA
jgi:hypothetical protein